MQNVNQNKINVILPQATCLFIIIINFIYCYIFSTKLEYITQIYICIIFYHIFIYYYINKGIKQKNYSKYNTGLILSLIYSIIATFSKFILFIILLASLSFIDLILMILFQKKDDNLEYKPYYAFYLFFFFLFYISFDWLLTIILLCYYKKIKNLCSNNNYNVNFFEPLNQPNLYIQNNFTQTNMINNQNLNGCYVQPYYPNVNDQSNVQNLNAYYLQTINPNVNIQSNTQNLNNNEVTSSGNIQ